MLFRRDEANEQVLETVRKTAPDLDRALEEQRLVGFRRDSLAPYDIGNIEALFDTAARSGAF